MQDLVNELEKLDRSDLASKTTGLKSAFNS